MSGRFRATATEAASIGTNTSSPSHFRRRHTTRAFSRPDTVCPAFCIQHLPRQAVVTLRRDRPCAVHLDRKSTRLNSSHLVISYAVFCLKKKKRQPLEARLDLTASRPEH